MLCVTVYRDANDRIAAISAHGHAEFAVHGDDVVCAAASAVLQAARLGLESHAAGVEAQQGSGDLRLRWPETERASASVAAIAATAELAIAEIAKRFPRHVRLLRRRLSTGARGRASGRVTGVADQRRHHHV